MEQQIGRYRLVEELGRGGMGIVYRAVDPVIDREVALKTLRNAEGLDGRVYAELRERFLNEARAAGRLQHPNIVAILDAGTDEATGVSYIAMEFVRGGDLEGELKKGRRYTVTEAAAIVRAVAEALACAHQRGVIHRDVKPANILRDGATGVIKMTDFGIARLGDSSLTRTGQVIGSPAYMSPEQITGSQLDHRSDIFSLGVVLYQLLTGERPFLGEGLSTLSYQLVHTEPVPPRSVNPAIPAAGDAIVRRALAKSPDDRFQSAQELADELRRLEQGGAAVSSTLTGTTPSGTILGDGPPTVGIDGGSTHGPAGETHALGGPTTASGTLVDGAGRPRKRRPKSRPHSSQGRRWLVPALIGAVVVIALGVLAGRGRDGAPALPVGALPPGQPVTTAASGSPDLDSPVGQGSIDPGTQTTEPPPTHQPPLPVDPAAGPAPDEPAADEPVGPAHLLIDFEHHFERGEVVLIVDGEERWRSDLRARKEQRFGIPKLKLAHQSLNADLELTSGEHLLTVHIVSQDNRLDDRESIRMKLRQDRSNLLKIRVQRVTNKIELQGA